MLPVRTFSVFGKKWTLKAVRGKAKSAVGLTDKEYGQTVDDDRVVHIDTARHADEVRETLLHELLHCVEYSAAFDVKEAHIAQLSVGLFAILRDNPKLRAFIFKG
jgi:hypothetical protein